MENTATRIAEAAIALRSAVRELVSSGEVRSLDDRTLITTATDAGVALRAAEACLIEVAAEIEARSQTGDREERLTVRSGCRNTNELLQRATGVLAVTASKWIRAGAAVREPANIMTGDALPAALPELRQAMSVGAVGVDGVLAVAGPLLEARHASHPDDFDAADRDIAATAIAGEGDHLPTPADVLRVLSIQWATALDQDGAEPAEHAAIRNRSLTIGALRGGLVNITARVLPEVATQLQAIADATGNPRVRPRFVDSIPTADDLIEQDPRTHSQKMHDALATALTVAAASEQLPTLGGAAPTLVIRVEQRDLVEGRGWANVAGMPVSLAVARHVGCSGVVQRVAMNDAGRVTAIGTEERVFNRHQRRAIALRDNGCVIPGCTVTAAWCEVHHVTEHAKGGETHTNNGVLLCWNHHRFLEHSGWTIRMNHGTPQVRPPTWIDPTGAWRKTRTTPPKITRRI